MKLLVKAVDGKENTILQYYRNYDNSQSDSGLEIFCLEDQVIPARSQHNKVNLGIICLSYNETTTWSWLTPWRTTTLYTPAPFYLFGTKRLASNTPIRLSNSFNIIKSDYYDELTIFVDNISDKPFRLEEGCRYFQICSLNFDTISFKLVDWLPNILDNTKPGCDNILIFDSYDSDAEEIDFVI